MSESRIRINIETGEVEITGSEAFVEKTVGRIDAIITKLRANTEVAAGQPNAKKTKTPKEGIRGGSSLHDFLQQKQVPADNHQQTVTAIVYYLTKQSGNEDCSLQDIEKSY